MESIWSIYNYIKPEPVKSITSNILRVIDDLIHCIPLFWYLPTFGGDLLRCN